MAITGKELSLAEDVFKLQHLLEGNLLAHRWGFCLASRPGWGARLASREAPCL
jgi:hypothetical protein